MTEAEESHGDPRERQQPRRRSLTPVLYGKAEAIQWKSASTKADQCRNETARFQHAFAVAIRRAAQVKHRSVKEYAEESDIPYEHLARMLRGAAPLTVETIAEAEVRLGGIYEAAQRQLQGTRPEWLSVPEGSLDE